MSIARIVLTVLISTLVGGLIGAGIGWALAAHVPMFYMQWFASEDPISTGIGFGVVHGTSMGFLLGVLIVLVVSFGKNREQ